MVTAPLCVIHGDGPIDMLKDADCAVCETAKDKEAIILLQRRCAQYRAEAAAWEAKFLVMRSTARRLEHDVEYWRSRVARPEKA